MMSLCSVFLPTYLPNPNVELPRIASVKAKLGRKKNLIEAVQGRENLPLGWY